ncbi:helix-turn-helix domain-containing protein [Nocardioides dongkuii]|uniref:helix-turn-helix domain-containing protein n=1 Tax=Nocardioides dongkuii TaxID=2760089 RepID=UPI0029D41A34|nr:AraC family transcriptional regulator [Nocardioides dongkuii]
MAGVPAPLAPYVSSLVAYDVATGVPGVHRGLPSTALTLVLPVGEPLDVAWAGRPDTRRVGWSSVSGLHTLPAEIRHGGVQRGVQLGLTPLGARVLLGVPAAALAGELLEVGEVAPGLRHLPEQVAVVPYGARAAVVAAALLAVAARADVRVPRPEVGRALARLTRGVPVQAVADEVGYSRRHLATLVRAETGVAPKQLQRVARLQRSRAMVGRRPLAEVATACGYADQAHLTREWTALAGCPPATWLREEFPFVQDAEPADGAG